MNKKIDKIKVMKPLGEFTQVQRNDQIRHLTKDIFLYKPTGKRYICSILGALYEECADRPDLQDLILEAVWIARRMNDQGGHQDRIDFRDS